MATTFPEELDSFLNPQPTDSVAIVSHAAQHADANDAIEALQAKLGVNNSLDTNSIDYRVRALENQPFDAEAVMDAVDSVIVAGSGITKLYEDSSDSLTISVDTSVIATQQFVTDAINALSTDDIEEGVLPGRLYFTDSRAQDAIGAGTGLTKEAQGTQLGINRAVSDTWYDAAGSATTAENNAKSYADGLAVNYDPAGSAAIALTDANEYTDQAVASLGNTLPVTYVPLSSVGNADGVASLGPDGKVPASELNITETVQDVAAGMITGATHTNISVSYDDNTGKLSFTASGGGSSLTQEEVQDFVAPLLNHAFHTNISATYDDANNRIVLQGNAGGGGGASVSISPTAPVSPGTGDIWLDSDNGRTFVWDGSFWFEIAGAPAGPALASVLSIAPSSPEKGQIWLNTTTAKTYIYDGMYWVQV